jgi:glycosyltransferase involved in cell wall biosynthesis
LGELVRARTSVEPTLVPNTIDRLQFDAPPRSKSARPTLGLTYSSTSIKGFDVAAQVVERVRAAIPELRVVCFSSEAPNPELPLPPRVEHTLRPAQDHIRELYAACDVWLSASRAEGFGLPALEAMACRTPLVSTRYGGPADFVRHGENGFLVEVDDVAGLTDRCLEVLRWSPERWRSMSDAAYATAHAYTWDDAAVKMEAVFERAASR